MRRGIKISSHMDISLNQQELTTGLALMSSAGAREDFLPFNIPWLTDDGQLKILVQVTCNM